MNLRCLVTSEPDGADQKIGRDAIERYGVLRKELDGIEAEADKTLGKG